MRLLYEQTGDDSVKPDQITYSTVLFLLSRSKSRVDVRRAEELMDIMEEKAKNLEILWPNTSAYTALINIIKNSGVNNVGEKAEAVMDRIDAANAIGKHSVKADSYVFIAGEFTLFPYHFLTKQLSAASNMD